MTIIHSSLSGHRKCLPLIVEDSVLFFSGAVPMWGPVSLKHFYSLPSNYKTNYQVIKMHRGS